MLTANKNLRQKKNTLSLKYEPYQQFAFTIQCRKIYKNMIKKVFTSIEHIWTFWTAPVGASAYICNAVVRSRERASEWETREVWLCARKRGWMDIKHVIINFPFCNYSSITCSRHINISYNKKQLQTTYACNINFSNSPRTTALAYPCLTGLYCNRQDFRFTAISDM